VSRFEQSRQSRILRGVTATLVTLILAGCGTGQLTGTSTQGNSTGGANGAAGTIVIRDAEIEFGHPASGSVVHPVHGTAPLQMRIVNEGGTADRLLSVHSGKAESASIGGAVEVPAGQSLVVGSKPTVLPGTHATQITLVGLKEDIHAGLTYPVVLTFEKAGPITLMVPVDNPTTPREPAAE
jgi:copper(I)-binding protein